MTSFTKPEKLEFSEIPHKDDAKAPCSCCGQSPKSTGISLQEAQRFQRIYRKEADEFLHGSH